MKIFLDNKRSCPVGWVRTRFPEVAIWLLDHQKITEISIDHDLGDDEKIGTGYDVLL